MVNDILDRIEDLADRQQEVTVDDAVSTFGRRTFGPAIMLPALIELTPIGSIPTIPTFLAVIISLVAVQKLLGRKSLWLPGFIGHRKVSSAKVGEATKKLRPLARFLDRHFHGRLEKLTKAPFSRIAAAAVILLCCTVPFLEVLPFASSGPMLAIAMFGLAVLVRDGALMIGALGVSLAALALGLGLWNGGGNGGDAQSSPPTTQSVRIEQVG